MSTCSSILIIEASQELHTEATQLHARKEEMARTQQKMELLRQQVPTIDLPSPQILNHPHLRLYACMLLCILLALSLLL
jgi:hypothetical protein